MGGAEAETYRGRGTNKDRDREDNICTETNTMTRRVVSPYFIRDSINKTVGLSTKFRGFTVSEFSPIADRFPRNRERIRPRIETDF